MRILLTGLMAGVWFYLFFSLIKKMPIGTFSIPIGMNQLLTIIGLLMAAGMLSLPVLFIWSMRPRTQSFTEIDLLPTGIIGTTQAGEAVTLIFDELAKFKLKPGNPARCRMKTKDGQVYWLVLPRPINRFVVHAMNPSSETQRERDAIAVRYLYRQGIRLLILGIVLASLSYALATYLASIGAILPANVRQIRRGMVGFSLLMPGWIGFASLWIAWINSPNGQRALKRFKARFSKPKDQT